MSTQCYVKRFVAMQLNRMFVQKVVHSIFNNASGSSSGSGVGFGHGDVVHNTISRASITQSIIIKFVVNAHSRDWIRIVKT